MFSGVSSIGNKESFSSNTSLFDVEGSFLSPVAKPPLKTSKVARSSKNIYFFFFTSSSNIVPLSIQYLLDYVALLHIPGRDRDSIALLPLTLSFIYSIQRSSVSADYLLKLDLYPRRMVKSKLLLDSITASKDAEDVETPIKYHVPLVTFILRVIGGVVGTSPVQIPSEHDLDDIFDSTPILSIQISYQIFVELCGTGGITVKLLEKVNIDQLHVYKFRYKLVFLLIFFFSSP